jgi:hypothetical protein
MKDLATLHHFLGVSVTQQSGGLFLSNRQYMVDILECAGIPDCKPCSTPVDTYAKLPSDGTPISNATHYRRLVGILQCLTFTCADIAYVFHHVCLYMHDPREPHLALVKWILRYI